MDTHSSLANDQSIQSIHSIPANNYSLAENNVPITYGITGEQNDMLAHYGSAIGPPFKPTPIREIWDPDPVNREKRLSETEMRDFIDNPLSPKSNRLNELNYDANKESQELHQSQQIQNMSLQSIVEKIRVTLVNIIDDLLEYEMSEGVDEMMYIFTKEDRLMYVGITVAIFSFIVLLIRLSDYK